MPDASPSSSPRPPGPSAPAAQSDAPEQLNLPAGVAAAVLPGLGYGLLGQWKRAACVFVGIMGLVFGGMLIGGIDVVDSRADRLWFIPQAAAGPVVFIIDRVHQSRFKVELPDGSGRTWGRPDPADNPGLQPAPNRKSLGKVNDVGSLYVALAGMLNLIAIIDCGWRRPSGALAARPSRRIGERRGR